MTVAPTSVHPGPEQHHVHWVLTTIAAFLVGGLVVGLLYRLDVLGGSSSPASGSGVPAAQVRHLPAFRAIDLAGSNNVVIHVGGKQSVVVRADDNLLARVTTKVREATLVVGNTPGSFTTRSPMSVEVRIPGLDKLTLAGSGNMAVTGIRTDHFAAILPGSGTITGDGNVTQLEVTVGGSGTIRFTGLVAEDVRALVAGSGSIFVTATKSLDATVAGSGSILYAGSPGWVTKNVTGSGAIVQS